jgi:hypothetical protein
MEEHGQGNRETFKDVNIGVSAESEIRKAEQEKKWKKSLVRKLVETFKDVNGVLSAKRSRQQHEQEKKC